MTLVTGVPQTNIPGRYATIDNTKAIQATAGTSYNMLIIGTATAGSSGPVDEVVPIFGEADGLQWGEGGMLDRMISEAKAANPNTPMFAIALAEAGGSAKGQQAVTFPAATATANATLHAYVGGQYTPVQIAEGDDENDFATKLDAAVTAKGSLCIEQRIAPAGGVASFETKFTGEASGTAVEQGSISIQFNRGVKEAFPPGMVAPTVAYVAGAGDPDITPAIAAMVDVQYTHIALPYEGSANQDVMKDELDVRFGPTDQKWGVSFTCKDDTTANLLIYGGTRNSQLQVTPAVDPGTASPLFECTSILAAIAVGEADPARPWQTLTLTGIVGAQDGVGQQRSRSERDSLLSAGIATTIVSKGDGSVQIERLVTNYRLNPAGAPDVSYKNLNTVLQVLVFRDAINNHFALNYPRYKLADDGNEFGSGQKVMTPNLARAEIISVFDTFVTAAIMENVDQFKADLVVERSDVDKDRLEYSCNPDTVNQFRIFAGTIAFIL